MKFDVLLFTQTMHSLMASSLSLQSSLCVCKDIIGGKTEKKVLERIIKGVNEGNRLADELSRFGSMFSMFYISLVEIGEESGMLCEVFERLSSYLKDKKKIKEKMIQTLFYPVIVLVTVTAVVLILLFFVMPRLESIFTAFTENASDIENEIIKMKGGFYTGIFAVAVLVIFLIAVCVLHRTNRKAAFYMDGILLKIPVIGKILVTVEMHDFSFAMKLFSMTHFPFVQSLQKSSEVVKNLRLKKGIKEVCERISDGNDVGDAFEKERVFPNYLVSWIKIAEKNGKTSEVFSEVCSYYSTETENLLGKITAMAEPVFILLTGAVIISIILKFVVPVFNLLGAL